MVPSHSGSSMGDLEASQPDEPSIGPVKILRRPKPQTNSVEIAEGPSQAPSNGLLKSSKRPDLIDNTTRPRNTRERQPGEASVSSVESSLYDNEDEWPSIADASKCLGSQQRPQQQRISVLKKIVPSARSSQQDETSAPLDRHADAATSVIKTNNNYAPQLTSNNPNKGRPNGPMKTYKERADDYAKARLRIMGSAFSEEDQRDNVSSR